MIASIVGGVIFFYVMKYVVWWVPNLADLLEYVKEPLRNSIILRIVILSAFVVVAFVLIEVKQRLIGAFGLFEIVGGGWTIWATFTQEFENNLLYALAIGGGVFLLINGIENMRKQNDRDAIQNNK